MAKAGGGGGRGGGGGGGGGGFSGFNQVNPRQIPGLPPRPNYWKRPGQVIRKSGQGYIFKKTDYSGSESKWSIDGLTRAQADAVAKFEKRTGHGESFIRSALRQGRLG